MRDRWREAGKKLMCICVYICVCVSCISTTLQEVVQGSFNALLCHQCASRLYYLSWMSAAMLTPE